MPNQLIALVTQLTAKRASSMRHSPGFGIATTVVGCDPRYSGGQSVRLEQLPDDLLAQAAPWAWPARFTGRNTYPSAIPAADGHASIATLTHVGTGIVRTRPCLPTRSTIHHRPSRCWTWGTVSAATSDRRDRKSTRLNSRHRCI